jgi:uncharacterized protein YbbC (DUF1343 family)
MNNSGISFALYKHMNKVLLFISFFVLSFTNCNSEIKQPDNSVSVGAEQMQDFLPLIKNKKVGIVANPTSMVVNTHLVDTLLSNGIDIKVVFAPEHGFRGEAEAGETINSGTDMKTGLKIVSLYGDHKKPTKADLAEIECMIFDIQDVGVRFYTYISTLQYIMEACATEKIPLIILDRPNPNGYFVDGPVLDMKFKSFVGMQPVPVVHGLTIAEYATLLNGEKWLKDSVICDLRIIKMKRWTHRTKYTLPVRPSPNLPNDAAINLYPSLCFFEGTIVSIGRGTDHPFQVIGYPENPDGDFIFTPKSISGVAKSPPYENQICKGLNLKKEGENKLGEIRLKWIIDFYNQAPDKSKFFNNFFDSLAGSSQLREQIVSGKTEKEIKASWASDLKNYNNIRKKYLLYDDYK